MKGTQLRSDHVTSAKVPFTLQKNRTERKETAEVLKDKEGDQIITEYGFCITPQEWRGISKTDKDAELAY